METLKVRKQHKHKATDTKTRTDSFRVGKIYVWCKILGELSNMQHYMQRSLTSKCETDALAHSFHDK